MRPRFFALGLIAGMTGFAVAQATAPANPQALPAQAVASNPASASPAGPEKYTVPAGTKVLLSMKSAINTKTARPGDGVYLISSFPVIVDSHVLIPDGAYVQGIVDRVQRPGRVKGRAQISMHFTSIIFPNGQVVEIPGTVNSLPGSNGPKVTGNEGAVEQAGTKGRDVGTIAKGAGVGATVGSIAGAAGGSGAVSGLGYGAVGGAAAGALYTLFTRGDDIEIPAGASVEMVLQRPLELQAQQYASVVENQPHRTEQQYVPSQQPQPLKKPDRP
ncbi:MAG TPA: hypothetical protein VGM27_13370 [Acidobacteriaceae bacterium]